MSLYKFLSSGVPGFDRPPANVSPPAERKGGTTMKWAGDSGLNNVFLNTSKEDFPGPEIEVFQDLIRRDTTVHEHLVDFEKNDLYQKLPVVTPSGEGDISTCVSQIFLQPIFHSMNKWSDWHELQWPIPHDFESLKLQLFTESFTSRKYVHPGDNPYVTVTSAPADPNTSSSSYPGVRTDFLFGFLPFYKSVNDKMAREIPKIVSALNTHVEGKSRMSSRGGKATAQKRAELAKMNWESAKHRIYMPDSQRQIMTYSEDEKNIVKTVVAVELKHFNHLSELEDFALTGIAFHGSDDLVSTGPGATSPDLRGLRSIMQQVVRYGLWYGARYIYLTDYENHVVIELDGLVKELEKKEEDRDKTKVTNLKWYKVKKEDGRWLLAWIIYRAGKDIRDDFRKHYLEDLKRAGL